MSAARTRGGEGASLRFGRPRAVLEHLAHQSVVLPDEGVLIQRRLKQVGLPPPAAPLVPHVEEEQDGQDDPGRDRDRDVQADELPRPVPDAAEVVHDHPLALLAGDALHLRAEPEDLRLVEAGQVGEALLIEAHEALQDCGDDRGQLSHQFFEHDLSLCVRGNEQNRCSGRRSRAKN